MVSPVDSFYTNLDAITPKTPLSIASCLRALEEVPTKEENPIQLLAHCVQEGMAKHKDKAQAIADMVIKSDFFPEIERDQRDIFLKASSNTAYNIGMRFLELGRMTLNRIRYGHDESKVNQEALCKKAVKAVRDAVSKINKDEEITSQKIIEQFEKSFTGNEPGLDEFKKAFSKTLKKVPSEDYKNWWRKLCLDQADKNKCPDWAVPLISELKETLTLCLDKEKLTSLIEFFEDEWSSDIENNAKTKALLYKKALSFLGYGIQRDRNTFTWTGIPQKKGEKPPFFPAALALLPQIKSGFGYEDLTFEEREESFQSEEERKQQTPARPGVSALTVRAAILPKQKTRDLSPTSEMMQKIQQGKFYPASVDPKKLSIENWLDVVRQSLELAQGNSEKRQMVTKVLNFVRDKLIPTLDEEKESFVESLENIPALHRSEDMTHLTKTFRVAVGLGVRD